MTDGSDPEILWHYTNAEGLKGIMESGAIWATDAEYLNDAAELRYGRHELIEALTQEAERRQALGKENSAEDSEAIRAGAIRAALRAIDENDNPQVARTSGVYVACFCKEGDLLSQWRGYAAGTGYALGFSRQSLAHLPLRPPKGYRTSESSAGGWCAVVSVSYRPLGPDRVAQIVGDMVEHPSAHPGVLGDSYVRDAIPLLLARHKHPAFEEEREWRVISALLPDTDWQPVQFRSGALGLLPYVELELPEGSVMEVKVGPGPDEVLRRKALRRLLEVQGKYQVSVTASEAPFRP